MINMKQLIREQREWEGVVQEPFECSSTVLQVVQEWQRHVRSVGGAHRRRPHARLDEVGEEDGSQEPEGESDSPSPSPGSSC